MAKIQVKFFSLCKKTNSKKAVANPVTIVGPVAIVLTFVDDNGVPVPGITATNVQTTLTSDNPALALTQVDNLNWTGAIPAGTTGLANLTATGSVITPAAGPFTASIACTLNIPASPPVPTDLTIAVTPTA